MATGPDPAALGALIQKYTQEANKRLALQPQGTKQFVELIHAENKRLHALGDDIWADWPSINASNALKDGDEVKVLIMGAGWSGILNAVQLVEAGFSPSDIRMVDNAGGFGGTWYWNRFPGIHCDSEAYIYLPLLEETGYVPTSKWVPGSEILEHANRVVDKWQLRDSAIFATDVVSTTWDETARLWTTKLTRRHGPGKEDTHLSVKSQYVIIGSGVLARPQAPRISGLETFEGDMFHTARWDYSVTGGSPTDANLSKLAGKRVGYIGTGATAIQAVPKLAQSAKELFVIQRTPSACYERNNRPTDPEEWKTKIAASKGWQKQRIENWTGYCSAGYGPSPGEENLVNDEWSKISSYAATIGSPYPGILEPTPEKIGAHIGALHAVDMTHSERMRARIETVVKDKAVAETLKPWYPTWCKRPTFSDEYLQSFNLPNVTLIDTDGKGVDSANTKGLVVNGQELPLDVLILSTGFVSPAIGNGSPSVRADIKIYGRGGREVNDKWVKQGPTSLHGVALHEYPNFFFVSPMQAGASANNMHNIIVASEHIAYIISTAEKLAGQHSGIGGTPSKTLIEVKPDAEEAWSMQIMMRAAFYASMPSCTPGYVTRQGEASLEAATMPMADQMKAARASPWGEGMNNYVRILEAWRAQGSLEGIEVTA